MPRSPAQLRADALAIWQAGVEAVRSDRAGAGKCPRRWRLAHRSATTSWKLSEIGRIAVVGAGKAGAGMAAGLEAALGPRLLAEKQVVGWINVPADCVRALTPYSPARGPAGRRQRTDRRGRRRHAADSGNRRVAGANRSLSVPDLRRRLGACFPLPLPGFRWPTSRRSRGLLSAAGANIQELNTVRKQLSRIKGGGLARACRAEHLVSLIISDVLGDPLDVIASGPTVLDSATPASALAVIERLIPDKTVIPASITEYLTSQAAQKQDRVASGTRLATVAHGVSHDINLVIGNNAVAVDAAGVEAERRGYSHAMDRRDEPGRPRRGGRHSPGPDGPADAHASPAPTA